MADWPGRAVYLGVGRPLNVMQRQLLVSLITKHKSTLDDRSHGIAAVQKKQAGWEEIHNEFNRENASLSNFPLPPHN